MKVNLKKHIAPSVLFNRPVWIVYGIKCEPSIICARLITHPADVVNIWGYSVYEGVPGFRTLGQELQTWAKQHDLCVLYDNQEKALQRLRKLTTPEKNAW